MSETNAVPAMLNTALEAAVAVEVMGDGYGARRGVATKTAGFRSRVWDPSTDIADAFEVVERMHEKGYAISITWDRVDEHPRCAFVLDVALARVHTAKAALPRAICEAALAAVRL